MDAGMEGSGGGRIRTKDGNASKTRPAGLRNAHIGC
jgi:hypothetical protein